MGERIPQNTAIRVPIQAWQSSDHTTPATGKTIAVTISKNGGAYANPAAGATNAVEIGTGSYYVDLAATDTNTLGPLLVLASASGIDNIYIPFDVIQVVSVTPPLPSSATPTGTPYLTPIDIANRVCDHCGVDQIDTVLGFTEVSRAAQRIGNAYPKLRQAELNRNLWRFATKKAPLRPVDSNTLMLSPALWGSTVTYFVGSIVADQNGYLWISRIPNNLNNSPGQSGTASMWEPYFGPLTASLLDSSKIYYSGEIVYTADGAGNFNVYMSRANSNVVHPALPNQWSAQTSYLLNQVVQAFPAWSSGTTYSQGQTVLYTDGNTYTSIANGNLNNIPPASASQWALIPVLTLVSQLVPASTATLVLPPTSSPVIEWDIATAYSIGSFVMFAGNEWVSIANSNTGNLPNAAASTFWKQVTGGTSYMSLVDVNFANPPATSASEWTNVFTQGGGNSMWMQIGGASFPSGAGVSELVVIYPVNTGPLEQSSTRNIFRLPSNYLRRAPQDPKQGGNSALGAPTGLYYNDWEYEGDWIVSRETQPIVFRFVADVADVSKMNPMFCEGLAARIALEVVEPLTQSTAKLQTIAKVYSTVMGEARRANGIEIAPIEPPMDDLISTRY